MAPYLYCTADKFEIRESTPWIELCFAVLGGEFSTKSSIIECLPSVGATLLKTLTPREIRMVDRKYGLDYHSEATIDEDMAESDNMLSEERQRQILNKAIRKLRHPSRAGFLKGKLDASMFESEKWNPAYYDRIENVIKSELKSILEKESQRNMYIANILQRNRVAVKYYRTELLQNCTLEELDLSVRSYNCLKRAGVTSLEDLTKRINEDSSFLYKIRNVGERTIDEIKKVMQQHKILDKFATVEVVHSGEKTIYKFVTDDLEKIAESIYVNELQRNNSESTILHGPFSPGLTEIFLMLGYFYRDDVFQDADSLCNRLQLMGFPAFAEELSKISQISRIIGESDSEDVLVFPAPYVKLAQENGCTNLADFKTVLEKNGHDVEYISRLFDV